MSKKEKLLKRALLNAGSTLLDFAAKKGTGFVVTPFLIRYLGTSLFGAYSTLLQFAGYSNSISLQTSQVLKWKVANERDTASHEEINRYVSAAFLVTLLTIPVLLILGSLMSYYAPQITGIEDEGLYDLIRITAGLFIFSMIILRTLEPFESLLRGLNIGYKKTGLRASIVVASGVGKYYLVTHDYSLIYIALLEVILGVVYSLIFFYVVKSSVKWVKLVKIKWSEAKEFIMLSGWFILWSFSRNFLYNSDKVVLGIFSTALLVGQYTIIFYLAAFMRGLMTNLNQAVIPGLGKFLGRKEFSKLRKLRGDYKNLLNGIAYIFLPNYILFNQSFVILWSNENIMISWIDLILIAIMLYQFLHLEFDSILINVTLNIKHKVLYAVLTVLITFGIASFLIPRYNITGLLIAMLIGRSFLSIFYPKILLNQIKATMRIDRTIVVDSLFLILILGASYLGLVYLTPLYNLSISMAIFQVLIINISLATLILFFQLNRSNRTRIFNLLSKLHRR